MSKPSKPRRVMTAIIYDKRGRVLSIGKNSYSKTHPLQARLAAQHNMADKQFLHAELDAIIRCRNLDKAHRIEVFGQNESGLIVHACPCRICMTGILSTPIKQIGYTTRSGFKELFL